MRAKIDQIKDLIIDAPIGKIHSINLIGSGYASLAYKVSSSNGDFVALIPKPDCIETPDYVYYFSILKTLEEIDYKYAPKAIYINLNQSVILMTYASGLPVDQIKYDSMKLEKQIIMILIDAILDLRQTSFERCGAIYKQLCGKELQTDTLKKSADHYITEWFEMAKNGTPNQSLINWIQPKVLLCEKYIDISITGNKIILNHEDISSGNVLITNDFRLNIIDWDTSSFYQYPDGWDDYGLGYLFNHLNLFQKHRSFVISMVGDRCGVDIVELEKVITKSQEFIKICDIMWAIMMNSRVAAGEIDGDQDDFLRIANERISNYEIDFRPNSFIN